MSPIRSSLAWGAVPFLFVAMVPPPAAALEVQDLYGRLAGGCWACDMLQQAGSVGLDVAQQMFDVIAGQLAALLGVLMALWILFLVGRVFLPFGPDGNPAQLWNLGARRIFAFAVILGFLQSSQAFWDYLFMPVLSLGTGLAVQLLSQASQQSCPVSPVGSGVVGAKAALDSMRCPLSLIQEVFTRGMLTGVAMTFGATWHSWMDFVKVWTWPGQILQMLSGVVLALVYAFGFVMFPLFFVDAVLRVAIIAVLAPLAAALSLFAPTRKVAERALWDLAQSALTLVFASVAAGLATQSVAHVYASVNTPDGSPISDAATLISALEAGTLTLSIADRSYWAILAVGFITIFMVRSAARMAASLTGAAAEDFSGATAGVAAMVAGGAWMSVETAQWAGRRLLEPVTASSAAATRLARAATRPGRRVRQPIAWKMGRVVRRGGTSLAAKVSGVAWRGDGGEGAN